MNADRAISFLAVGLAFVSIGGCATSPEVLCDHDEVGLTVMATPPADADSLIADIAAYWPRAIDPRRHHVVWLSGPEDRLYLCTYRRGPVITGRCGGTVYDFGPATTNGRESGNVTIPHCG